MKRSACDESRDRCGDAVATVHGNARPTPRKCRWLRHHVSHLPFLVWLFVAVSSQTQLAGEFRNLGFDEANTNNLTTVMDIGFGQVRGQGRTADLLPGWQFYYGDQQITERFGLNDGPSLIGYFTLVGRNYQGSLPSYLVEGAYGFWGSWPLALPLTFIQSGEVPSDKPVLTYRYAGSQYGVWVNGQRIPLLGGSVSSSGLSSAEFDLSTFAGREVELKLVTVTGGPSFLDSIAFIPEPSTVALWSVAGLALLVRFWWKVRN